MFATHDNFAKKCKFSANKKWKFAPRSSKFLISFLIASVVVCLIACICVCVFQKECFASDKKNSASGELQNELEQNVDDNLNILDFDSLDKWLAGLDGEYGGVAGNGFRAMINDIINGNFKGDFNTFSNILLKSFAGALLDIMPMLLMLVAIAVLFSILNGLTSGFLSTQTKEIIYFVCYSSMIIMILVKTTQLIGLTKGVVGSMQSLMELAFPLLVTAITMLGGINTAAVFKPMMAVLSASIMSVISKFVMPLFIAIIIFCVVGNLSKEIRLEKITNFFHSLAKTVLGAIFSIFVTFLSLQGLTGNILDSVSVKTAKFAMQSYVPILGGYLSDGFDLLMASVVLIKNSMGVAFIVIIVATILSPIIKIAVFSLGLKLVSGIVEPLCDERFSKMTSAVSKNLTLLIVIIIGVAF
ncbi:MAG: stage III sporulation protein AE, partial [Clostridia bacterium]